MSKRQNKINRTAHRVAKFLVFIVVCISVVWGNSQHALVLSIVVWFYGEDIIFPFISKFLSKSKFF